MYDLASTTCSGRLCGIRADYGLQCRGCGHAGGVTSERFRYVGLTSAVAQTHDGSGTVIRSLGTDWTGTHLLDWTGTGANVHFYVTTSDPT